MSSEPVASFFVAGQPQPQGSKTAMMRGNKIIMVEGKGKGIQLHKDWRKAVKQQTLEYMDENGVEMIDNIVRVELSFRLQKPKSKHKKIRAHYTRPDIDKLARAVLDGITALKEERGLIPDDSHVVQLYAEKFYAMPGEETGVQVDVYDIDHIRLVEEQPAS